VALRPKSLAKPEEGVPEADLRRLLQSLREVTTDRPLVVETKKTLIKETLSSLEMLAKSESIEDFVYPFTKGINTINEGLGFGELVQCKVGKVVNSRLEIKSVTSLRTRTGKLRLPSATSAAPVTTSQAPIAKPRRRHGK